MAEGHTPKVDSSAKFVGVVGAVLLLAAIYYLVSSLVYVVTSPTHQKDGAPSPIAANTETSAPASATQTASAPAAPAKAMPVADKTSGNAAAGKTKYATCAACHGADGKGNGGAFPNLTKLSAADAEAILHAFKKGDKAYLAKHGLGGARYGTMAPQAAGLSDADIANLGAYIAELGGHSAKAAEPATSTAATAAAKTASASGDAAAGKAKYATCAACHGADGKGNGGAFPNLTKLSAADAEAILHAFKKGDKAYLAKHGLGGARYGTMAPQAAGLSDTDIADLGAYIAELGGHSASATTAPVAAAPAAKPAAAPAPTQKIVSSEVIAWGHALFSSCAVCHGAAGEGGKLFGAPKLAGLPYNSVVSLLNLYRKGQQMGANSYAMIPQAKHLTDSEINALASYIAVMNTAADKGATATE